MQDESGAPLQTLKGFALRGLQLALMGSRLDQLSVACDTKP
jgi:hypothetical protein